MAKEIRSRKSLETLLQRYKDAGVTNQTKDVTGGYEARWLDTIQGCIDSLKTDEPICMDEIDFENTPDELKPLWRGLK